MVNISGLCVLDSQASPYLRLSSVEKSVLKQMLAPYDMKFYGFSLFEYAGNISLRDKIDILEVIESIDEDEYSTKDRLWREYAQIYQGWYLTDEVIQNEIEGFLTYLSHNKKTAAAQYKFVLNKYISQIDTSLKSRLNTILRYTAPCEQIRRALKFKPVLSYILEIGENCYGFDNDIIGVADKKVHPNGLCDFHYKKIYLNTEALAKRMSSLWSKHYVKHVYFHEVSHAMDYGYCSYNIYNAHDLKLTCSAYESNFRSTVLDNKLLYKKIRARNRYGKYLDYFHGYRRFDARPESFNCYLNGHNEFGHFNIDGTYVDTSQAQVESFAESMAFLVRVMTEGFNDFDLYRLKQKHSYERSLMKSLINSLYYLVNAVDWKIFNLNDMMIRHKKREVREYLSLLDSTPVALNTSSGWGRAGRVCSRKIPNVRVLKQHLYR